MYVYMKCICLNIRMCLYMFINTPTGFNSFRIYTCFINIYKYAYMYVYTAIYIYTCQCMFMYIIYLFNYMYMLIYICVHYIHMVSYFCVQPTNIHIFHFDVGTQYIYMHADAHRHINTLTHMHRDTYTWAKVWV